MSVDLGIWSRLTRLVIFLFAVAGLIAVVIWYQPLIHRNERLRKKILELDNQVQGEEQANRRLEAMIKAIQHDPRTVERIAREKLNWARPGETVIRFEDPAPNQGSKRPVAAPAANERIR